MFGSGFCPRVGGKGIEKGRKMCYNSVAAELALTVGGRTAAFLRREAARAGGVVSGSRSRLKSNCQKGMVIAMKKTIFAVSDIHGHYTELMEALADAGFDENNDQPMKRPT